MALKHELDKIDDLPETVRGFYESKDGKFVVSEAAIKAGIETDKTLEPLKKAKEHERTARQDFEARSKKEREELETQMAELREQLENIDGDKKRKNGDIDALLKSQADKLGKTIAEKDKALEKMTSSIRSVVVDAQAKALAAGLAIDGGAEALLPHIQSRLSMEISDGEPKLVVLDKSGKPTVNTVDDLKEELFNSPALSRLIKGSSADGGGANNNGKNGGGAPQGKPFSEMTIVERAAFRKQQREGKR